MGVAIPAPKSSRRRATWRTLEGSRAAPHPPFRPHTRDARRATRRRNLHSTHRKVSGCMEMRRVVRCVGCFDNNILDFEYREWPPTTTPSEKVLKSPVGPGCDSISVNNFLIAFNAWRKELRACCSLRLLHRRFAR